MSSENKHMTLRCTPFLLFDGTCAEAMTFYSECFGGDLAITKLGDSPMKDQLPPEKHDRILTSSPPSARGFPSNLSHSGGSRFIGPAIGCPSTR